MAMEYSAIECVMNCEMYAQTNAMLFQNNNLTTHTTSLFPPWLRLWKTHRVESVSL